MAQANSVPTAISRPITGATSKASTNDCFAERRYFSGGSDARTIKNDDETTVLSLSRENRLEAEPEDLSLHPSELNRRWYKAVAGRMSIGSYIVAVACGTAVILLGSLTWSFLLILLLFSSNKRLHFSAFETMPSNESMQSALSCGRGSSL